MITDLLPIFLVLQSNQTDSYSCNKATYAQINL